jgi:hypothetical protein
MFFSSYAYLIVFRFVASLKAGRKMEKQAERQTDRQTNIQMYRKIKYRKTYSMYKHTCTDINIQT